MSDINICNKCYEDNKYCIEGLGDPHHPDDIYKICREFKTLKLEQENDKLKSAIKAELKRCGGTVPILNEVLKEVE